MSKQSKVVPIFPLTDNPELFIAQILHMIREGKLEPVNVMVAMKQEGGGWATAYCNIEAGVRAEGIAHLQIDLIDNMILDNAERYGLHSHDD